MNGQIAIVTGSASGIGRATALRLANEGAIVVAIDRDEAALRRLAGENKQIQSAPCDVTDHANLERIIAQTLQSHSRIDILVNNAGMSYYERHLDSTLDHWRKTQAINVEAMYLLAKLVVPAMVDRRYGRIVNVASTQALAAEAVTGAYAASKGAIAAWTRSLAVDLAEYGILVNCIAPGCTHTAMSNVNGVDETTTPDFQEWYVRRRKIPLARAADPAEIANAIYFLCGDQCTYITGHTLVVDGGLTITF
ncbi:MAG: SDR family oxidoreductase [Phycisphaerales bacterium]|jgi:NAD(P)-dependent dehydrogenase (short-subunit alcohol dehydrogenase family)|nr:SDR family oxidoreductase [Phycisphaerales bacterium]